MKENFMMIKDKLLFSQDYSLIKQKCFSCGECNHSLKECPKIHFVPNIERIIKKAEYPIFNERAFHIRRKNKMHPCHFYKNNKEISTKLITNLKSQTSIYSEIESETNINDDKNEDFCIESLADIEKGKLSSFHDSDKSIKTQNSGELNIPQEKGKIKFLIEKDKTLRSQKIPNLSSSNEIKELPSQKSLPKKYETQISGKNREEIQEMYKSLSKEDTLNTNSNPNHSSDNKLLIKKDVTEEFQFDKVANFDNYFPSFNIKQIINNQMRIKILEKEIQRKFLKHQFKKFKDYCIFVNPILEKFYKEKQQIKKKKRNHSLISQINQKN